VCKREGQRDAVCIKILAEIKALPQSLWSSSSGGTTPRGEPYPLLNTINTSAPYSPNDTIPPDGYYHSSIMAVFIKI